MIKSMDDRYTLSNGLEIPIIGFGTWRAENGEEAYNAVMNAISVGYRHIDTAAIYGNEESVGEAIKNSNVNRKDIFITSKLWNTEHSYKQVFEAFEATINKLKVDVLDLYLIHWPNPKEIRNEFEKRICETWMAMEELYLDGKIRAIGVSNFMPHHLAVLKNNSKIQPMVNQIRLYPGSQQVDTINYCMDNNILLEGYSPFGSGKIFSSPELAELSFKYNKTIAQICVRWSLQMGFLPLPKSVTKDRIKENIDVFDFELLKADVKKLKGIKNNCGPNPNPDRIHF